MQVITQNAAAALIRNSGGKLFSITFVKRGDRKKMATTPYDRLPRRRMVARIAPVGGWKTGVTGEGMKYNPQAHDLVHVREFVSQQGDKGRMIGTASQFRNVPIEGIERIKIHGCEFAVQ